MKPFAEVDRAAMREERWLDSEQETRGGRREILARAEDTASESKV
jgi:hypothetical protein